MTQYQHQSMIVISAVLFAIVLVMNFLANSLPLGGITTGAVSYRYPNLFQPSGMTFSIWGVIYILLSWFTVSQLFTLNQPLSTRSDTMLYVHLFFSLSSIFNVLWLLSWHYQKITLSMIMMILLLVSLLFATQYAMPYKGIIATAFSVYLGWISVATIANAAIFLVSFGVPSFSNLAVILTLVVLLIGALIGSWYTIRWGNLPYGLVFVWAYLGILLRHYQQQSLPDRFMIIITSAGVLTLSLVIVNIFVFIRLIK